MGVEDIFWQIQGLSMLGVTLSASIAGLAYMLGEATSNPRLLAWSKAEVFDIAVSGFVAFMVLFAMGTFLSVGADSIASLGSGASAPSYFVGKDMYDGADFYLKDTADITYANMLSLRNTMGGYEKSASMNKWECTFFCLMGGSGTSISPNSGLYTNIGTLSTFLQGATVSHLTVFFQIFVLRYIYSATGLLGLFLPLGLVLRTLPFVRGLGGVMVAIAVSLYILYPFMLVVNGIIFASVPVAAYSTGDPGYGLYASNALTYIRAIFLPGVNFLVIAAAARSLSGALGDEVDISRLGQMV